MLWIVLAAMTAGSVLLIVWPLMRSRRSGQAHASDLTFYREQLSELDADVARGLMPAGEAGGARAEIGRRLIAASDPKLLPAEPPTGRRRRAVAALLVTGFVPVLALGLYLRVGSPAQRDAPLASRDHPDRTIADAVSRVETHLAQHPEDGKGFDLIAPIYLQLGRFDDAANAYAAAARLLGPSARLSAGLGQAMTLAADGVVTAAARNAFQDALDRDAASAEARFFLGVAAEQDGDKARARSLWTALAADAPADAPWLPAVRRRLAALDSPAAAAPGPDGGASAQGVPAPDPGAAAGIAALSPEQRDTAIRGMVDGLAARLAHDGHDAAGWLRLVRAYRVLGDTDKARQALIDARRSLDGDQGALAQLAELAKQLGLEG